MSFLSLSGDLSNLRAVWTPPELAVGVGREVSLMCGLCPLTDSWLQLDAASLVIIHLILTITL